MAFRSLLNLICYIQRPDPNTLTPTRAGQSDGIRRRFYAQGSPRGGLVLPHLSVGQAWRGADIGWSIQAARAQRRGAQACVPGAALSNGREKRLAHLERTRCLAVSGRQRRGYRLAAVVAFVAAPPQRRRFPQSSARPQATRSPMRVQTGQNVCHNLPHQIGEENKSPIATTMQTV